MASLPEVIFPRRLARRGTSLAGFLPVAGMRRLGDVLAGWRGDVRVALTFDADEHGAPGVRGSLAVTGRLPCQRCLETMDLAVRAEVRLAIVEPGRAQGADSLDADEPWEIADEPVALAAWVEDELLLAVPDYPMHPPGSCPAGTLTAASGGEGRSEAREDELGDVSPFAVLEVLKRGPDERPGHGEAAREEDDGGTAESEDALEARHAAGARRAP